MHVDVTTLITTLATLLVGGCFRYLGRIDRRLKTLSDRDFSQDLWILDHEQRLQRIEPKFPRRAS
jgi:hypothetical protein